MLTMSMKTGNGAERFASDLERHRYADADQDHYGTIYQATNWIYLGIQNENGRGGVYHPWKILSPQKHTFERLETAIKDKETRDRT